MKIRMAAAAVVIGALGVTGAAVAQKETRGVTKTEIVLGMHTDLSGPAATYGVSSSNAVKMRFDEANATGGIHGRKIRLVVEDSQYQVPRAACRHRPTSSREASRVRSVRTRILRPTCR